MSPCCHGGVRQIGGILGWGRAWLAGGHCSGEHMEMLRGDEVFPVTPCRYRRHPRPSAVLERLFPLPPAPTGKALPLPLPLPPRRAAAFRPAGVHAKPKVNCQ